MSAPVDTLTASGTFKDAQTQAPIVGATLKLTATPPSGTAIQMPSAVTQPDGSYTSVAQVPASVSCIDYVITAKFVENGVYDNASATTTANACVTVSKDQTTFENITLSPASPVPPNTAITVTGSLLDVTKNMLIADANFNVGVANFSLGVTTDANGNFSFLLGTNLNLSGKNTITFDFLGDSSLNPTNTTTGFTVQSLPTKISGATVGLGIGALLAASAVAIAVKRRKK